MKEFYQIHELAELFGLHPDTLRYYEEKGLIRPVRGANRYRQYGIQDICTLNIIRSLRDLGMSVEEIGGYLARRTVEETCALLEREESLLRGRIAALELALQEAEERRRRLARCAAVSPGRVELLTEPERPYVFLREDVILEGEIDFQLKRLESRHQDYIKIMGRQCMGAVLDQASLARGVYNHFSCVFFLTDPGLPCDAALPAGEYARLFYRGSYQALESHLGRLLAGAAELGRAADGPPLELYRVDAHDTNVEGEYVTELQIKVRPGDSPGK